MVFKFIFKLLLIFININIINGYDLCVLGASSGLGREIIYQGLNDNNKNNKILALTCNPENIKIPYRGGGLSNKNSNLRLRSLNLEINNYENFVNYNFSNIVFCSGAKPFSKDYSDIITKNILECETLNLQNIVLISAYGVGNSLPDSNAGIKIMNSLYLQDVYRAKNAQEELLENYKKTHIETNIKILRPKALSYGVNLYAAKSRETFAKEILEIF
tara:strand:- start:44 stop:694 length:651 start_codon:yes stop_codon:yes gene_type:complete